MLGFLLDRPMHGYEINQQIKVGGVTTWFNISMASIYYSLNKLHRQGLISETRSSGGGADKSVYHLTEQGREQFFSDIETALGLEEPVRFEYDLGIVLLNKLPQEQALALLEKRLDFLRRWHATLEQALSQVVEQERAIQGRPLRMALLERSAACTWVEAEWLMDIIRQLRGERVGEGVYRGLMILSGDLRDFHLPDLIKLIVSGRHRGTLTVTDGASTRTLSFREGRPVCASSHRPDGVVRKPELILNDVYDLFRWQEGGFTFDQRMRPQEGCLTLQLSAENLLLAGARWVDNWTAIQQIVPSSDTVFERRGGRVSPDELDLTEDESRVLSHLDGLRDVASVARECGLTEFETIRILYALHAVGLVQPEDIDKVRLRRVFREFAELMCRGTRPYRSSPDDLSCEREVNRQCAGLQIYLVMGRIEDHTSPGLRVGELADVYRTFLRTQRAVVRVRFGEEVVEKLMQQVLSQINPGLRDILERYDLV
jgi:DNA-binding PadR family transcriptional regulator